MKRRNNILYKLRKKGYRANTRERTIFFPYNCGNPLEIEQIPRLMEEFGFRVQFFLIDN